MPGRRSGGKTPTTNRAQRGPAGQCNVAAGVVRRASRSNTLTQQMQLASIWREHLAAGCPSELAGVEIAGSDARTLDAEINACVSALICRSMIVDERIERRLTEISTALVGKQTEGNQQVATYCARLNRLVSAVLTESRAGRA
jgi:hypothetical protein